MKYAERPIWPHFAMDEWRSKHGYNTKCSFTESIPASVCRWNEGQSKHWLALRPPQQFAVSPCRYVTTYVAYSVQNSYTKRHLSHNSQLQIFFSHWQYWARQFAVFFHYERYSVCNLLIYLLTYGAEFFLRSCQLYSQSRISQHFMEPEFITVFTRALDWSLSWDR
jgi:hypothetical protein